MLFFFYSQLCKMIAIDYHDINFYLHTTGKPKIMNNLRIYVSIALFFYTHEISASQEIKIQAESGVQSERMERENKPTKSCDLKWYEKWYKTHERSTHLHGLKLEYKGGYCGTCIRQPHCIPCCLCFTCCANLAEWHVGSSSRK